MSKFHNNFKVTIIKCELSIMKWLWGVSANKWWGGHSGKQKQSDIHRPSILTSLSRVNNTIKSNMSHKA